MIPHWPGFEPLPGYPDIEVRRGATEKERRAIIEALGGGQPRTKSVFVQKPFAGRLHMAPLGVTRESFDGHAGEPEDDEARLAQTLDALVKTTGAMRRAVEAEAELRHNLMRGEVPAALRAALLVDECAFAARRALAKAARKQRQRSFGTRIEAEVREALRRAGW